MTEENEHPVGAVTEKTPMGIRAKFLITFMVVLLILWGTSFVQSQAIKKELIPFAEMKIDELSKNTAEQNLEFSVPVITVTKEYILFGKANAKVALYMRPEGYNPEDARKADDSGPSSDRSQFGSRRRVQIQGISGIQYFLEKTGEEWIESESSNCGREQCDTEGEKAFKTGLHIAKAN